MPGHLCDQTPMTQPFDAKEWKTSAPIYYFAGVFDPLTPPSQAIYHSSAQTKSNRTFISVPEGSHLALSYNLADCQVKLWAAMGHMGTYLQQELSTCYLQTAIRHAPAGTVGLDEGVLIQ